MAQDSRVFIYNEHGSVIADGHYHETIEELINQESFIGVVKEGSIDETVNVPVNSVGSIRVYQTVLAYLKYLKETNDALLEDSSQATMEKVNVHFANGATMGLNCVFDVRLIDGWTAMTCYDTSGIIFTHLMPPKSISNFETSHYEDKNECPIAEKMVWLLDKELIEKFIKKYESESTEKKDNFINEFKSWLIGIGIKPLEFVFGLSNSLYILSEDEDRDEYIKAINTFCEDIIDVVTENTEDIVEKTEDTAESTDKETADKDDTVEE